jgi:hypothetical protein
LSRQIAKIRVAWQTSHVTLSSKALVNRDKALAQGTAATTTPCTGHEPAASLPAGTPVWSPVQTKSRPRQRRGLPLGSIARTTPGHTANN